MSKLFYNQHTKNAIISGFDSIQNSCQNEYGSRDWYNADGYADYYTVVKFKNGSRIPLPLMLDAVCGLHGKSSIWAVDMCEDCDSDDCSFYKNDLQLRIMNYWIHKTGLLNDSDFVDSIYWAAKNYNTDSDQYKKLKHAMSKYISPLRGVEYIHVSIPNQTVTAFNNDTQSWGTCNFYEAGLDGVNDEDIIIEHLQDRSESPIEVIFEEEK